MLTKALKSFRGRYGLIHAGTVFECETGYFQQLQRNGLAEAAAAGEKPKAGAPGPEKNRSVPAAPSVVKSPPPKPATPPAPESNSGKDATGEGTEKTSDLPPADGQASTSSSLRQALASRGRTSRKSEDGETQKT